MADTNSAPQTTATDSTAFTVRDRLIWASKPMGLLFLLFWVFHPHTTVNADYLHLPLIGFLVGVCYGLLIFWQNLNDYMGLKQESHRFAVNRVPDEYFLGVVTEELFVNK